jgi:hypothetical protein
MTQALSSSTDRAIRFLKGCFSQLEFRTTLFMKNALVVLPSAAFEAFWQDVLRMDLEDIGVTYRFPEQGSVRVFLQVAEVYEADYRADGDMEYRTDCVYMGILEIDGDLDQHQLRLCAEIVLKHMKSSAREFLKPGP